MFYTPGPLRFTLGVPEAFAACRFRCASSLATAPTARAFWPALRRHLEAMVGCGSHELASLVNVGKFYTTLGSVNTLRGRFVVGADAAN